MPHGIFVCYYNSHSENNGWRKFSLNALQDIQVRLVAAPSFTLPPQEPPINSVFICFSIFFSLFPGLDQPSSRITVLVHMQTHTYTGARSLHYLTTAA